MAAIATAARCPYCSAQMQLVISERYHTCLRCPTTLGMLVYVPIGDAPPHPMHGTRIAAKPVYSQPPKPRPAARRSVRRRQPQGARR